MRKDLRDEVSKAERSGGFSYKPTGRDSRSIPKKSAEFLRLQHIGKEAEQRHFDYLCNLGAEVKDISGDIMPDGTWSPFDLTAKFPTEGYIIDSKDWVVFPRDRTYRNYLLIKSNRLVLWEEYKTDLSKIILFEVESEPSYLYFKMYNTCKVDNLFISVSDIRSKGVYAIDKFHIMVFKPHLKLFRRLFDPDWAVMK